MSNLEDNILLSILWIPNVYYKLGMPIESYETQYTFDTDDKFPIVISTRKYWVYSATFFFFFGQLHFSILQERQAAQQISQTHPAR